MTPVTFTRRPSPHPTPDSDRAAILAAPGFGRHHTDHMASVVYTTAGGWADPQIVPYGPLALDPFAMVLHYGQSIFEGLKAYRHADGGVWTFRAEQNARRFRRSAERMAMPQLPEDLFLASLRELVEVDEAWVPAAGGEESLYLRPFLFATEAGLGVRPATEYRYLLVASPAGAYFAGGVKPVSVWLSTEFVRACPGGTGAAKFAGNYAASLIAQEAAMAQGCDQVVWLDALERRHVEEMGGMNLFFVFGAGAAAKVVTPELSGSLLPGVTRDSILQLARDAGYGVEERKVSVTEWREAAASGALTEVFACGTAAVVTPVGTVRSADGDFAISGGATGPVTMRLREQLTGIQRGVVADTHGWMRRLL